MHQVIDLGLPSLTQPFSWMVRAIGNGAVFNHDRRIKRALLAIFPPATLPLLHQEVAVFVERGKG